MFIQYVNFLETPLDDPDALNMNGGQTVHGGQIGENIHNNNRPYYYGKRMIGKCIQFFSTNHKTQSFISIIGKG